MEKLSIVFFFCTNIHITNKHGKLRRHLNKSEDPGWIWVWSDLQIQRPVCRPVSVRSATPVGNSTGPKTGILPQINTENEGGGGWNCRLRGDSCPEVFKRARLHHSVPAALWAIKGRRGSDGSRSRDSGHSGGSDKANGGLGQVLLLDLGSAYGNAGFTMPHRATRFVCMVLQREV